jgi:hypothetical protein
MGSCRVLDAGQHRAGNRIPWLHIGQPWVPVDLHRRTTMTKVTQTNKRVYVVGDYMGPFNQFNTLKEARKCLKERGNAMGYIEAHTEQVIKIVTVETIQTLQRIGI